MTIAYDYPLLSLFWTMFLFSLFVAWWVLVFHVIVDIFRSHDLGGVGKAAWALLVWFLPIFGVVLYLAIEGKHMSARDAYKNQARDIREQRYYRQML